VDEMRLAEQQLADKVAEKISTPYVGHLVADDGKQFWASSAPEQKASGKTISGRRAPIV
jgi:hypothetical protein